MPFHIFTFTLSPSFLFCFPRFNMVRLGDLTLSETSSGVDERSLLGLGARLSSDTSVSSNILRMWPNNSSFKSSFVICSPTHVLRQPGERFVDSF